MDMASIAQLLGGGGGPAKPMTDDAEHVVIASLAILKMLRHGVAGRPLEVMGVMLGQIVDDYTVRVVDTFAMPQVGTSVTIEDVDPVFTKDTMDLLKQTGRHENLVGWYHSHPSMGCFLSSPDLETARSYEQLLPRSVSVVVDPCRSVLGRVDIEAFRTVDQSVLIAPGQPESRDTTSALGLVKRPDPQQVGKGMGKLYHVMPITYCKSEEEQRLLRNVHARPWTEALAIPDPSGQRQALAASLEEMARQAKAYATFVKEGKDADDVAAAGHVNPRTRLENEVTSVVRSCVAMVGATALCGLLF